MTRLLPALRHPGRPGHAGRPGRGGGDVVIPSRPSRTGVEAVHPLHSDPEATMRSTNRSAVRSVPGRAAGPSPASSEGSTGGSGPETHPRRAPLAGGEWSRRIPLASGLASVAAVVLLLVLAAVLPESIAAQEGGFASQTLGRGYTHVFIAYAIAWVLVLGWALSIARRLAAVERELDRS